MQLGSASSVDLTTLYGFTRFCAGTLENVNSFTDAQILALLNQKQKELQAFILSALLYDWKENTLEGTGNGLINITAGTNNYAFPSGLATLDRVEINYTGSTNGWVAATVLKQEEIDEALSNTSNNNAIVGSTNHPIVWVRNGKIYIDPVPYQTVTGGLKVFCTVVLTDLAGSTDSPVFPAAFHDIPCRMAAWEWLEKSDKPAKGNRQIQVIGLRKAEMVDFYASRDQDSHYGIVPKYRNFR